MNQVFRYLSSIWFWGEMFLVSAIMFPFFCLLYLLTVCIDKRLFLMHKFTCLWSFIVLKINPLWRIKVIGKNKINPREAYLMVSNHQSGADIFVLFLMGSHFKWVAKKSLFYFPIIGWTMALNHYIALERGKGSSMRKMMENAARKLEAGSSVMIFPEGTRSDNGNLQPFKSGAFHLALENQRPILPVAIKGTSRAIQKGGFLINKNHDIRALVLDPIPYEHISGMDSKQVTRMVHDLIQKALAE